MQLHPRHLYVAALVLSLSACGGTSSRAPATPLSPSPPGAAAAPSPSSPGVFTISGFVLDTGFRPLEGASVVVIDGPQAGTSATADATGWFSLSGAFDSATKFRASKNGFTSATQPWSCSVGSGCTPSNARPWLGFYLGSSTPPVNITGEYTLTIVADGACTDIPSELRTRTYRASITPSSASNIPADSSYKLTVDGASFLAGFSSFTIGVVGDYVDLWLDGGHDPPLVEELAPTTYLAFSGNAAAVVGTAPVSSISMPLHGWIEYSVMRAPMSKGYNSGTDNTTGAPIPGAAQAWAHCDSENHRIVLTRR